MIDIWLIFSLIKPFIDILITTYIDHETFHQVGGESDVNKMDHSVVLISSVPTKDLVNAGEQKLVEIKAKGQRRIRALKKFSRVINPLFCVSFVIIYWVIGLHYYYLC